MSIWDKISTITKELMEQPLNCIFLYPFDYKKDRHLIPRPMDFDTIKKKISSKTYETPNDWYNDVCQIYQNALIYHPEGTSWNLVAQYKLKEFQKKAKGLSFKDSQEWYNEVSKTMKELTVLSARSPVPQGVDPFLENVIKQSITMVPPKSQTIAELVERLNKMIDQSRIHNDVIMILKKVQPDLAISGEKLIIDADKLSHQTLNALFLYINAVV